MEEEFSPYLVLVHEPMEYLIQNCNKDHALFSIVTGVIGDFSRAVGSDLTPYANSYAFLSFFIFFLFFLLWYLLIILKGIFQFWFLF